MGQGDDIHGMVRQARSVTLSDNIRELFHRHELGDGQFANRQDELRTQQVYFGIEPLSAVIDLILAGHPVAAFGVFAGKTATDGGHVDTLSKSVFIQTDGFKPAEECFTGCPGKGFSGRPLFVTRSLSDQQQR